MLGKPDIKPAICPVSSWYFSFRKVRGMGFVIDKLNLSTERQPLLAGQPIIKHRQKLQDTIVGWGIINAATASEARSYVERFLPTL